MTVAASASTHSLNIVPGMSSSVGGPLPPGPKGTRLRSNSTATHTTTSGTLVSPPSPADLHITRSLSQAPLTAMPTAASAVTAPTAAAVATPPPRPPRGPARSPANVPRSPSRTTESPTVKLIVRAVDKSKDGGDTLDLSRERLERIADDDVDVFRTRVGKDLKGVWRLALSYNSLRDGSIAASFASLSRLRYLNLKGNHLSFVPPSITELPALEILDLSKNQIACLPENAGSLANLKVLSLSNNRLTTLPTNLATFVNLRVFKVDQNPIVWPPPDVLGPLIEVEKAAHHTGEKDSDKRRDESLRPWIEGMKLWLKEQAPKIGRTSVDDDAYLASAEEEGERPNAWVGTAPLTMKKIASIPDQLNADALSQPAYPAETALVAAAVETAPPLRMNPSTVSLPSSHHDRSASSSSLTPPASATSSSQSIPSSMSSGKPPTAIAAATGHNRGASDTATHRLSGQLTAKKSLPDLRQSHAKIIEERRGEAADEARPLGFGLGGRGGNWHPKFPSQLGREDDKRTVKRKGSMDVIQLPPNPVADISDKRGSQEGPAIDESRNSYFRRVSMLPPSTISKAVSPALLKFIDAVRGLLFALTQLHSALRQYLNFAVSDRVAGVFARVVEPAGSYLTNLINALDRFDSMSRRSAPPASTVRAVIDAAKESIAVFAKIVAVLRLQTPAFRDADVRYSRQLLLNLYGGMSEIASSWAAMSPLLLEIRPILWPNMQPHHLAPPMTKSNSLTGRTPVSPILERGESQSPARPRTGGSGSQPSMPPPGTSPRAKSRRHAGSFSTQDVERGMLMGSPSAPRTDWPDLSRTIYEDGEGELPAGAMPPPFPLHAEPEPPAAPPHMVTSFSQPARSRHAPQSSQGSSHLSAPNGAPRKLSVDVRPPTPASATLYDEEFLDVIERATDVAFAVWLRLAEEIGISQPPFMHSKSDSMSSSGSGGLRLAHDARRPATIPVRQYADLVSLLSTAEHVTTKLRESYMGLRANPFSFTNTTIPDDTHAFIKTVVSVSQQIKTISTSHTFSQQIRSNLSQLTQSARECAILMQVSSLRSSASTPALVPPSTVGSDYGHSPMNPMSSNEDLAQPLTNGLRGLHLPTRHPLRGRPQHANSPPMPDVPRFGGRSDHDLVPPRRHYALS
ncbi:RAM signaling network component [Vanrija albida]|uniref:RAM signaling network component n=1 Tax=Vanrija albida TaxID=181172 RepID=A0ABR3Q8K8_9TREE